MAKINTLTVEGTKRDGYTVTAMTDDGTLFDIKEGFEFYTAEEKALIEAHHFQVVDENEALRAQCDVDRETMNRAHLRDLEALKTAANEQMDKLYAEIGDLKQTLAARPPEVRVPLMHVEHQDVPTARTVDKLAPLDALTPAPTLDEPYIPDMLDPDAPARPPGPGEMMKIHKTDEEIHETPSTFGDSETTGA